MELDVHLTREGEEPWGFEFIGGAEHGIPLTIDKVFQSSSAEAAGLQPGDLVARLGDRLGSELTQEAAAAIVAEAVGSLSFGICRGLYDPVLDDYEPIYEPIERADSALQSEPTEVPFSIQQFGDPNDLSLDDPRILDPNLTDPSLFDSGYATRPLTETRSLTASPFVPNVKPYRPFSTEPLEVPPLDDPIILNPNYEDTIYSKDQSNNVQVLDPAEDHLLRLIPLDKKVEARFKLPISEKYDPDYDKKVKQMLISCINGTKREIKHVENELVYAEKTANANASVDFTFRKEVTEENVSKQIKENIDKISKDNMTLEKRTKDVIDTQIIEKTALKVVEESIERAVSVTEEIQKEVEEELRASMTREMQLVETEFTSELETLKQGMKSKAESKASFLTTEKLKENDQEYQSETKATKREDVLKEIFAKEKQFVDETRNSTRKETGDRVLIKEQNQLTQQELKEVISADTFKRRAFETGNNTESPEKSTEEVFRSEVDNQNTIEDYKSTNTFETESMQSESKQKAFMIGLQTIPHIKGFVQSSYHFDLLLRTFFVHLTDVMVALSRFILTQPTNELELKSKKGANEKLIREFKNKDSEQAKEMVGQLQEIKSQQVNKVNHNRYQHHVVEEKKQEMQSVEAEQETRMKSEISKNTQHVQNEYNSGIHKMQQNVQEKKSLVNSQQDTLERNFEDIERRKKTGAEMAQMTQRKSKDLTKRMDAVITEFEFKTGIEDITEQSQRRSRSKSRIEEEVMKEGDSLEWLDKVDSKRTSQERTNVTSVKKEFSAFSESKNSQRSETKHETKSSKVKPGKQMYVGIVESHVYTNQEAILEDQVIEMSETASYQNSQKINAASEAIGTIASEKVAINNVNLNKENQQAVEIINNALEEVVQENQQVLESVTNLKSRSTAQHSKSVMHDSHRSIAAESTEFMKESEIETYEAKKSLTMKAVEVEEESYKSAAVEFVDVPLETTKNVAIESQVNTYKAVEKQDLLASVAAESTDVTTDESIVKSFKTHQSVAKTAVISAEPLAIAVSESTDVTIDDSNLETFQSKETIIKQANVISEDIFKAVASTTTEMTLETAEEEHSERALAGHVTIREETQGLAVAGIIETKTEICKERRKPVEDEYASLKIIKEEIVEGGESIEVISESELNVKKSLEVEINSSQHIQSSISQSHTSHHSTNQEISSSTHESCESSSQASKLHLRTDLLIAQPNLDIIGEIDENNNTPSPSTVPPTPLTDEYMFKLEIPLPKNEGTVVIEESPDREDPHIVKKGLVPHIETTIEEQIIYDPPLPTPPEDKVQPPMYTKPGLKGGAAPLFRKDYIREIERKSSLLASAIDETIKSIEDYKVEVGIDKKSVKFAGAPKTDEESKITNGLHHTNGFSNGHSETESDKDEDWVKVEKQVTENSVSIQDLSKEIAKEAAPSLDINGNIKDDNNGQDNSLPGFKTVVFNPEAYQAKLYEEVIRDPPCTEASKEVKMYVNEAGEPLGTVQGIVDGLADAVVDEEVSKELGKPGLTEDKIAVLISGESEMLREAHVMGLSRVLTSHMTRADDSSVDFQKIKPLVDSLKDSEVLKVLNEELLREKNEKKKKEDEKKWTTFLQKPKRPVPRVKFGYYGYVESEEVEDEEPYKVKIVKQPKPKVAPDYKPEDFETGPLPWEQRALTEPVPSPVPPEDPILVPEETPQFLEAVDPLPESEVPDLEDTGIPLPASPQPASPTPPPEEPLPLPDPEIPPEEPPKPQVEEPPEMHGNMDQNKMAEQLVNSVKSMVDPHASLEQQLSQMRAQLAALAQLPCVIQQSLEMLTRQLTAMSHQGTQQSSIEAQMTMESRQDVQVRETTMASIQEYNEQETTQNNQVATYNGVEAQNGQEENYAVTIEEMQPDKPTVEEYAAFKREEEAMVEEQKRMEKEKKERQEKTRLDQESRQIKQRAAPRVGKPRPAFGPLTPEERPVVLPGGRRWRGPKDAYNEQMIAETLQAQSEILQGKVMGINFMKYEKPPVSLDHLQNSATYKLIHNMEEEPMRRVDQLTPVVAEADYRERCRSATPCVTNGRM